MAANVTMGHSPGNDAVTPDNATNATTVPGRDEFLAKFEIGVLAVILYMALFGNGVVITVLSYRRRKFSRMQLFIIHLAIADISVGLFQVLPQLVQDITFRFDGNDFLCKLVKYMQVCTMYSSTYVLLMTALDRYMSICHPLTSQTWTSRRVHLMIGIAWTLSALFSIPQVVLFSYKQRFDGVYDCLDNFDYENKYWTVQLYVTWIFLSIYAIPCVILTVCYCKICYIVWVSVSAKESTRKGPQMKHKTFRIYKSGNSSAKKNSARNSADKQQSSTNPRAHSSKRLSKAKVKTIKLTLTVILCFIFCWAPFFITQMWSAYDVNAPYYTSHVIAIVTLLSSLNSCTNPWIYLAFSGRVCSRKRPIAKTWTTTANTFVDTEATRMRTIVRDGNGHAHGRLLPDKSTSTETDAV